MLGAIIIVTVSYYAVNFGLGWGLRQSGLYIPLALLIIPPLLAGYFGGIQFVRTERAVMRISDRFICAVKSCFAIVLAPLAFAFAISLIQLLSVGAIGALPSLAAWITAAGLISTAYFMLWGIPMIFAGLTAGQWIRKRHRGR